VKHRFFDRGALPPVPVPRPDRPVLEFPIGSVAVKSAWVDVTGLPPALVQRLYTRTALVKRAAGDGCARLTVGLVGLHIAQKTASRPQWIWSSFEQKDLVPPKWADWPGAFRVAQRRRSADAGAQPAVAGAARPRTGSTVQHRPRRRSRRSCPPPI